MKQIDLASEGIPGTDILHLAKTLGLSKPKAVSAGELLVAGPAGEGLSTRPVLWQWLGGCH